MLAFYFVLKRCRTSYTCMNKRQCRWWWVSPVQVLGEGRLSRGSRVSVPLEVGQSEAAYVPEGVAQPEGDHESAVEVRVGRVVLIRWSPEVDSLHGRVEQHLQDGDSVVTIAVSSRLVHRLRNTVLFIVSVTPSCLSSPSPRLVYRLRHPVLSIVSVTLSCLSSTSPRLVHRLHHPVLFIVSVTPSCSSSQSLRLVYRLRHPVTRSYIITMSYYIFTHISPIRLTLHTNNVNCTHQSG